MSLFRGESIYDAKLFGALILGDSSGTSSSTSGSIVVNTAVTSLALGADTQDGIGSNLAINSAGTITGGSIAASRPITTISAATTVTGSTFISGLRAGLVVRGTMNDANARLSAAFIKLDISSATLTAGQLNGLWVDAGSSGSGAGGGQFNLIRCQNTTQAVPNAHLYVYGSASFLADLNSGAFNPGILSTTGTAGSTTSKGWIKVKVDGATRYIPLTDSVS